MTQENIKLYGTDWCSDCKRSKKFLGEQRIRYEYINIENDQEGQAFVQKRSSPLSGIRDHYDAKQYQAEPNEKRLKTPKY